MSDFGDRLRAAREAAGLSQSALARLAKVSQPTIADLESGKNTSTKKLPEIASALGVTPEDLDPRYRAAEGYRPPPGMLSPDTNLPVYAAAEGGNGHWIIGTDPAEYCQRPRTLDGISDAYGILITGESMVPAFEPDDIALVNPRLPASANSDVIVYALGEDDRAMIKRLKGWTETDWTVQQYNPAKTFKLKRGEWGKCHRVVGKLSRR